MSRKTFYLYPTGVLCKIKSHTSFMPRLIWWMTFIPTRIFFSYKRRGQMLPQSYNAYNRAFFFRKVLLDLLSECK